MKHNRHSLCMKNNDKLCKCVCVGVCVYNFLKEFLCNSDYLISYSS